MCGRGDGCKMFTGNHRTNQIWGWLVISAVKPLKALLSDIFLMHSIYYSLYSSYEGLLFLLL